MVINDTDYSVYCEILCPGETTPVASDEAGPVLPSGNLGGANVQEFTGTGNYTLEYEKRVTRTRLVYCNDPTAVNAEAYDSGWQTSGYEINGIYAARMTIYNSVKLTYVCSGPNAITQNPVVKVERKQTSSDAWTTYDTVTDANGNSYNDVYVSTNLNGSRKTYYRIKRILRGSTQLYP